MLPGASSTIEHLDRQAAGLRAALEGFRGMAALLLPTFGRDRQVSEAVAAVVAGLSHAAENSAALARRMHELVAMFEQQLAQTTTPGPTVAAPPRERRPLSGRRRRGLH